MQQVTRNVFAETQVRGCNHGFVTTSEGVVMIDSPQKPTDALKWRAEVEKHGQLKYIINSPQMHIWHHAKTLPKHLPKGVNFGLTLSIWDYLFGTAYVPKSGKDIEIGFDGDERFPHDFTGQLTYPFKEHSSK